MPTAYADLLLETQPQVIETREQFDGAHRRLGELIRLGRKRAPAATKLMRLLTNRRRPSDCNSSWSIPARKPPTCCQSSASEATLARC